MNDHPAAPTDVRVGLGFTCPACGAQVSVSVPLLVDLDASPELRGPLIKDSFPAVDCRECGTTSIVPVPGVVVAPDAGRMVVLRPAAASGPMREPFVRALATAHASYPGLVEEVPSHRGAFIEALLDGHWQRASEFGLQLPPAWISLFEAMPRAGRAQAIDLVAEGGRARLERAIVEDPAFGEIVRKAMDPSQLVYTPTIEAALAAAHAPGGRPPDELLALTFDALADCAAHPDENRNTLNPLYRAIAMASRALPLEPAGAWANRHARLAPVVVGEPRAVALFNLAGGAFDRLGRDPRPDPLDEALLALFEDARAAGPPADLTAMLDERIGSLRLGLAPSGAPGIAATEAAARGYAQAGQWQHALRAWRRLMLACARATGHVGGAMATAHLAQALAAAREILGQARRMEPAVELEFAEEIARVVWFMPGVARSERQPLALAAGRRAVELVDRVGTPSERARIRLQLANLLMDGDEDAALVEEALDVLQAVEALPNSPTMDVQRLSALGLAFKRRVAGDRAANLESAIAAYEDALAQLSARAAAAGASGDDDEAHNRAVADEVIRYNLGNVMLRRLRGDRRENLARAQALHHEVLARREAEPASGQLIARSLMSIGNVHFETALAAQDDPALRTAEAARAAEAYARAVPRFPEADVPQDAALAWRHVGQAHALAFDAGGDPAESDAALAAFERGARLAREARDVAREEEIAGLAGGLHFAARRFAEAAAAYADALRLREAPLLAAVSGLTRDDRLAALAPYGARLAYSLLREGRIDDAIEAVQATRAVNLRGANRVGAPDAQAARAYRDAWQAVRQLEDEERALARAGAIGSPLHALAQQLAAARTQLREAARPLAAPHIAGDGNETGFARLVRLAPPGGLAALVVTTSRGSALVFARHGRARLQDDDVVFVDANTEADLRALWGAPPPAAAGVLDEGVLDVPIAGWSALVRAFASGVLDVDAAARAMDEQFLRLGCEPLVRALLERTRASGASEVVLVVPGVLQALPLAMSRVDAGPAWAADTTLRFQVGLGPVAPSTRPARPRMLVVADPSGNLPFARWEAEMLARLGGTGAGDVEVEVLRGPEATRAALLARLGDVDWLHLACHARHDWSNPSRSALTCADGPLDVATLAGSARAGRVSLVVLSGCDSAIAGTTRLPDEFIGLPAAFLALGTPCVIGATWSLPDEASAVLMARFYRHLRVLEPARALAAAQRELASGSAQSLGVAAEFQAIYEAGGRADAALARRALAHRRAPAARPYARPLFWGAFTCLHR